MVELMNLFIPYR